MATTTLENGQVIVKTATDLTQFISKKQSELDVINHQISELTTRQNDILQELQSLITSSDNNQ